MLKKYQRKQNAPDLTAPLPKPQSVERRLRTGGKNSRSWGPNSWNDRKPDSRVEIQNTIFEGIASVHSRALSNSEAWDADMEGDDAYDKSSAGVTSKVRTVDKVDQHIASILTVPYASYIGAIVNSQFVLRGFLDVKACYDVHAAKDLHTGKQCTASVYTISGTKGKERGSRLRNFKRNAAKASCIASVDQNRKKGLFFPASLCPDDESVKHRLLCPGKENNNISVISQVWFHITSYLPPHQGRFRNRMLVASKGCKSNPRIASLAKSDGPETVNDAKGRRGGLLKQQREKAVRAKRRPKEKS